MAKKLTTPAEINDANRKFWAESAHQWEAVAIGTSEALVSEVAKRKRGPKAGGKSAAEARKAEAGKWHTQCVKRAWSLIGQGKALRELAGILAPIFEVTPQTIRSVLKKAKVK